MLKSVAWPPSTSFLDIEERKAETVAVSIPELNRIACRVMLLSSSPNSPVVTRTETHSLIWDVLTETIMPTALVNSDAANNTRSGATAEEGRVGSEAKRRGRPPKGTHSVLDGMRLTIDFGPEAAQRLEKLKTETECTTYAEVIRNALRFYEFVLAQQGEDKMLGVIDRNGGQRIIQAR